MSNKGEMCWECPNCGSDFRKSKQKLFRDEQVCPVCKYDGIRTWETRPRGRKQSRRSGYTIRLTEDARKLLTQRQKVAGGSLSDAVEFCVFETLGRSSDKHALKGKQEWRGLLTAQRRDMNDAEHELFNEVYLYFQKQDKFDEEDWGYQPVGRIFTLLKHTEDVKGLALQIADDYTQMLCGLLSVKDGYPELWAYTLYVMFREMQRTVTLNDWIHAFSEGIPTYQANVFAWQHQQLYLVNEGQDINFCENPTYWS